MKKTFSQPYIIPAALLLVTMLTSSCKKLIEIPASPPTEIVQSEQFADSATTMTGVAQVYSYVSDATTSGFAFSDAYLTADAGLSADELLYNSNNIPDRGAFFGFQLTNLNSDVNTLWSRPYTSIYPVNAIIEGVGSSTGVSAAFKKQITAEMQTMRAFYYFNLVNLFGGVPLSLTTDYKVTGILPRASVDSVYGQILADLTSAKQNLSANYPSSGHVRPNQLVATALLARVYLYRQQWQQAYDAASAVIGSGQYSLVTDPNKVFLDGSVEAIWQLPATGGYYVTKEAYNFHPSYGAAPSYPVNQFLLDAFEPGDIRMNDWLGQTTINGNTLYYPYKYKNVSASSPTTEDYMLLRLAEQYLIRAEASAELGNGAAALADLNIVRARAGLGASTADASSKTAVLDAVMHERQVELFTEWGHRWFDLKRTGRAATVLGTEKSDWTANAALYPIPKGQLQNDPNLKQNPGY